MPRTGFFIKAPAIAARKQTRELHFISIGGEQFHALAVALMDQLKSNHQVAEAPIKILVDRFLAYYPKFKSQQSYSKPMERMLHIVNNQRKSETVECMAFVLRQLVVDEIYRHPLAYREVFDNLTATTAKEFLRQSTTVIPATALRALTEFLGFTLVLSFTEHGKELRKRVEYTNDKFAKSKIELVIQVQGDQYFPGVKNSADFAYVGQLAIHPPLPVEFNNQTTESLAEILSLINDDNRRLLQTYNQWKRNILTMIEGNELTTSVLMDLYIKFLPVTQGGLAESRAFAKLTQVANAPVVSEALNGRHNQLNELLAGALAGWVCTNKIHVDQLFERMDSLPISAPGVA